MTNLRTWSACHAEKPQPLTGGKVHRINYEVPQGTFVLDDACGIGALEKVGRATAELKEHLGIVRAKFLNGIHAAPFSPAVSSGCHTTH
jgi:hypothetical protein